MTSKEFNRAEIEWAKNILAKPNYTMASGKTSHQVAYEVLNAALDRVVETHSISAWGVWE